MPLGVYREYFVPNLRTRAKAQSEPLAVSTKFYMEMDLADEKGWSLEQFYALPRQERRAWLFFKILKGAKEKYGYEKAKEESERRARLERDVDPSVKSTRYRA